jgi:uncharacterized membrane protein
MYGSVKLGIFLDAQYHTNRFALVLSVFGLIMVLWLIYKQSKSFWNNP